MALLGLLLLQCVQAAHQGIGPMEDEVEAAVRKELHAWRESGQPILGEAMDTEGFAMETARLGHRIGAASMADGLASVGHGQGKRIKGSVVVDGELSAQRVVVKDSLSAPGFLSSSITVGEQGRGGPGALYLFSALHCHWEGQMLKGCPSEEVPGRGGRG
eukprot:TRINITY_DN17856_c0_g1_i7.p2 TRINITY_DN17856_c0_g1~~TRINITY_DN17856_c0_g1_i7.p2  ORF type:complete len:160 (+),score=22.13 TRINITY_DN17856_c0_g1_i7:214-693(+)